MNKAIVTLCACYIIAYDTSGFSTNLFYFKEGYKMMFHVFNIAYARTNSIELASKHATKAILLYIEILKVHANRTVDTPFVMSSCLLFIYKNTIDTCPRKLCQCELAEDIMSYQTWCCKLLEESSSIESFTTAVTAFF